MMEYFLILFIYYFFLQRYNTFPNNAINCWQKTKARPKNSVHYTLEEMAPTVLKVFWGEAANLSTTSKETDATIEKVGKPERHAHGTKQRKKDARHYVLRNVV